MSKRSKDSVLLKIITLICIAALFLVIAVGVYFIKNERDSSSSSSSSQGKSQEETAPDGQQEESTEDNTSAEPSSAEENSSTEPVSGDKYDKLIGKMDLHQKICQLFIVTPESLTGYDVVTASGDATKSALEEYPVGGLVYFAKNLEDEEQAKAMLSGARDIAGELGQLPLFLAVDEEGGDVARCADTIGTTKFSPMYDYKEQGESTAYSNAYTIAKDISGIGFNLDFAPVADTWSNPENTVIGKRAYSDDFAEAAALVASAVKGFKDGGVYCSLKHFPGHGDTKEDSHLGTATASKTPDELANEEYLAFESGIKAGADMVMVGHITVTSIDDQPATISEKIIKDELRGRLGYDGVVVTDSLAMGAVADMYDSGELAVKVIEAGADILLMPQDVKSAVSALEEAVKSGQISEERIDESLRRILILKGEKMDLGE